MKNLKTLIKLRKSNINAILQRVALLETHITALEAQYVAVTAQMQYEIERFKGTEFGFVLDSYIVGARDKQKNYMHGIFIAEEKIKETKLLLNEEYSEMKKLEIVLENRQQEERFLEEKMEMKLLDDLSIMRNNMKA